MAVKDDYGHVYVINFGDDKYFKIGFTTTEPEKRLLEIQRTPVIMPNTMSLVMSAFLDHPYYVEQILHSKFEGRRVKGEWFELNFPDLVDVFRVLYSINGSADLHDNWFDVVPKDYQKYIDNHALSTDFPTLFFTKEDKHKFDTAFETAFADIKFNGFNNTLKSKKGETQNV